MILLNDILNFQNLKIVKLRFNLNFGNRRPAIDYFTDQTESSRKQMLEGQYWNYSKKGNFQVGDISLGFVPVPSRTDCWLLFHVGKVIKDLNIRNGAGYDTVELHDYDKFIGRIIIRFKNHSQNLVRKGETTLPLCELEEILPYVYNNDSFPGYDKVNISWRNLNKVIDRPAWSSALKNQKAVYLIVDHKNGKKYVGAAYSDDMLYGRWKYYMETCHGGNKLLKKLDSDYIKDNFYFTILETFNYNVDNDYIIHRESFWKEVLCTRCKKGHGYNDN